jgi:hypothetical protein
MAICVSLLGRSEKSLKMWQLTNGAKGGSEFGESDNAHSFEYLSNILCSLRIPSHKLILGTYLDESKLTIFRAHNLLEAGYKIR